MSCNSEMTCRSRWVIAAGIVVLFTLLGGGCGDFIPSKSAGTEATRIIKDLRKVETAPEPNIPLPQFFTAPPEIIEQMVGGQPEYKLFYFCRHHTSDELKTLVSTQFASKLFDAKGKSTRVVDYGVSSNPATNQLIVRCPALEDAEAVLELLQKVDVPPIQVKISCLISEVYADKTLDWETTLAIEDFLGESISAGPAGLPFGENLGVTALLANPDRIAAFPGGSLRELARAKMGLQVGYLSGSHKFVALVDMLESQGYLKILMNPTLEVVNGKTAKILSSQKVPLTKTYLRGAQSDWFESKQEWEDIVDSLEITPHVYADGYIGLETSILLGSKLTPEGIKQLPIVTKKQITNKETRIRPGESLIIGGLRKSEKRDVIRGIPFLKDIPLLGILFSGRDFEERVVETVFILTPSISTGGIPREEMLEDVERKHGKVGPKDEEDAGIDLFGSKTRKKEQQHKLEDAEQARLEAEAEKAKARSAVRQADDKAKRADSEVKKAIAELEKVKAEALQIKADAEKAKADAEAKAKAADQAKAAADKAAADVTKTKAEAEKLVAEAKAEEAKPKPQQPKEETSKAKQPPNDTQKAEAKKPRTRRPKAEAGKSEAETEKPKAEAGKPKAETEKPKAEAGKPEAETEKPKAEAEKEKTEPEA